MVPFQCNMRHFRNIMGRSPWVSKWQDHETLEHIRRAALDLFWSWESSAVGFNLREARRMETKVADWLEMPSVTPPMGPFPLRNKHGMSGAITTLDGSLDPGRHADNIQHGVFWKVCSSITNIIQAGVGGSRGFNGSLPTQQSLGAESACAKILVLQVRGRRSQASWRDVNAGEGVDCRGDTSDWSGAGMRVLAWSNQGRSETSQQVGCLIPRRSECGPKRRGNAFDRSVRNGQECEAIHEGDRSGPAFQVCHARWN
jgi:hypothetical protein